MRLRTPAEVVVAVPYLLGFQPSDSLVLLVFGGPRSELGLSVRLALPDPADGPSELAMHYLPPLRAAAARAEGTGVHLLVYPDAFDDPVMHDLQLPRRELVQEACAAFAADGRPVREATCVVPAEHGYRYWSYFCEDPRCCPIEGRVAGEDDGSDVRFAFVSAGRAPLASRAELVRSLAPQDPDDPAVRVLAAACATARAALDSAAGTDLAGWRRRTVQHLDRALADLAGTGAALPVELQGVLAVVLHADVQARDVLLGAAARDHRLPALVTALTPLVRRLPQGLRSASAATAAAAAYLAGEGALAWTAVDRALEADPRQPLAGVVAQSMAAGLPPYDLADFVQALPGPDGWDAGPTLDSDGSRSR